jgi:hypothetical protein
MVTKDEEGEIGYTPDSPLNDLMHPARPRADFKSVPIKKEVKPKEIKDKKSTEEPNKEEPSKVEKPSVEPPKEETVNEKNKEMDDNPDKIKEGGT